MNTSPLGQSLTDLVRRTVHEVIQELRHDTASAPPRAPEAPAESQALTQHVLGAEPRRRTETVRIDSDADLAVFVARLLTLIDNPKARADLRNGWLRFTLARPVVVRAAATRAADRYLPAPPIRITNGVLTERAVEHAAAQGRHILTDRAVAITPLARDKARALGVRIEKET